IETIQAVVEHQLVRKAAKIPIAVNQFQSLLYDDIAKAFKEHKLSILCLQEVTHTKDKVARIQGLQGAIASGRLRFCKKHIRLIEQLVQFPYARHDEGPDALEMAVVEAYRHFVMPMGRFSW